jgi:hypothetical protein
MVATVTSNKSNLIAHLPLGDRKAPFTEEIYFLLVWGWYNVKNNYICISRAKVKWIQYSSSSLVLI